MRRLLIIVSLLCSISFAQGMGGKAGAGGTAGWGGGVAGNAHSFGRSFNGTNQTLNSSTAVAFQSTKILSLWFWLNQTTFNNSDELAGESSTNYNNNAGTFLIDPNAADTFFDVNNNVVNTNDTFVCHFARPSAAAWHSYLVVWNRTANPTTCAVYVDGSSVGTTTSGDTSTTTQAFTDQTIYLMSRAAASLWNAGSLSDIAMWKADEGSHASTLNSGTLPSATDSGNLISYTHLCGTASPEPDTVGAWSWTLTGTPAQVTGPAAILNCP